jgi:Tol biopolymer transport system component
VKALLRTHPSVRRVTVFFLSLAAAAVAVAPAQAAFPGKAGPIAYTHIFIRESGVHDAIFLHGPRLRDHPRRAAGGDNGGEPAFSPNGRLIAFTATGEAANPARSHVFVMKVDGTGIRQLTSGPESDSGPAFSPNGKQIVFSRRTTVTGHLSHLFVVDADGTGLRQLTSGPKSDTEPVFAPDGRSIAFVSNRASSSGRDRTDIFTMSPTGTGLKVLINGPSRDEQPDFSPDGKSIAFASDRNAGPNIFIARANGSHPRQITHSRRGCTSGFCYEDPSWAPDGRHIAYIARGLFASDLQVMKPDGTGGKTFSEDGTEEEGFGSGNDAPAWGPVPR